MKTIVTHISPDWDAIGATWLLKRFVLTNAEIAFVNTGNPDLSTSESADAVVDTGRVSNPARFRFDHHQLTGPDANATCATSLVYDYLRAVGKVDDSLAPLIGLIYAGDTGKSEANLSRSVGIHALLSCRKARRETDAALMAWGFEVLDDLASHLKARAEARLSLAQHTVFKSPDGLVWALEGAPQGATFAAFEEGARLVVFHSEQPGTVSVGCMRGGEQSDPHVGDLVGLVHDNAELQAELERWFRHPAGFFAGRGTAKAPDPTPLTVSIVDIASELDYYWSRA